MHHARQRKFISFHFRPSICWHFS